MAFEKFVKTSVEEKEREKRDSFVSLLDMEHQLVSSDRHRQQKGKFHREDASKL